MRAEALAICAGALAASVAGAAQASPAFDAFQQICVAHRGDRPAALAAATAAGWRPVPQAMLSQISLSKKPDDKVTEVDGRFSAAGGGVTLLIVGRASRFADGKDIPADLCVVGATAGTETLGAEAAAFAAVPGEPDPDTKNVTRFVWRAAGETHIATPVASLDAAKPNRDVTMLAVGAQGPITMLALAVPTK